MDNVLHFRGGQFGPFSPPGNVSGGPQKCPKTAFFDPKWPYLAIGSPRKPKWVEHWLNMVEHCQTHPGGSVGPLGPPKSVTRGPQRRPKLSFLAQKGHFLAIDTSSRPKWCEHWLNKVEHCQTQPGGSVWAFWAPQKCHQRAREASKIVTFGPKMTFPGQNGNRQSQQPKMGMFRYMFSLV